MSDTRIAFRPYVIGSANTSFVVPPSGGGDSVAFTNFIARTAFTSPTDDAYINAYKALLNGLTTDGIFVSNGTSTKLDFLYIFCTKDLATALLNLVSGNYNATDVGSITFAQNNGCTGSNASTTAILNTNFNPFGGGVNYTQDAAHLGVWVNYEGGGQDNKTIMAAIGATDGATVNELLYPHYTDDNAYFIINTVTGFINAANTDSGGYWIGTRSDSAHVDGYKDGSPFISSSTSNTVTMANLTFYVCGFNANGVLNGYGTPATVGQLSAAHAGGSLSATDVTNLNSRIGTFRTAVGL